MSSSTAPLRVAIVGSGWQAQAHARALRRVPGAKPVAVFSSSPERAAAIARTYRLTPYTDLDGMLEKEQVDMVTVATANHLHAPQGMSIARRDIPLLVEKPLDSSPEAARRLVEECEARGVPLGVVYPMRFDPRWAHLRRALREGTLGSVHLARVGLHKARPPDYYRMSGGWRGDPLRAGGGVLINQAIHLIDLLLWLLGPTTEVCASTAILRHPIGVEDTATALLRFESGALGVLDASTSALQPLPATLELHGEKGSIAWDEENHQTRGHRLLPLPRGKTPDTLQLQMDDFAEALRTGRPPRVDGREGLRSLQAVEALYRSASTGQRVTLNPAGRQESP